jgi:DNA-binding transcriptional LysR family regulator
MELIKEAFDANGLALPSERVTAASIMLRNQLLATGRYVTMLPDSILRYTAKQYSLKALPIDLRIKPWPIAIVTLKNRTVGPAAQLFVEHLRAVAKTISRSRRQQRS